MYNRIYETMFDGSMYGQGALKQALWAYVLSKMKPNRGRTVWYVELNASMLSHVIGEDEEGIKGVLEEFCGPDDRSRIKDEGGAKLVKEGQFLYRVVNGAKYNTARDAEQRRDYMRGYMRKRRVGNGEGEPVKKREADPGLVAEILRGAREAAAREAEQEPAPHQSQPPSSPQMADHGSGIPQGLKAAAVAARRQPEGTPVIHVTQAGMQLVHEHTPHPVSPSSVQSSGGEASSGAAPASPGPPSFDGQAGLPPLEESDYPI